MNGVVLYFLLLRATALSFSGFASYRLSARISSSSARS